MHIATHLLNKLNVKALRLNLFIEKVRISGLRLLVSRNPLFRSALRIRQLLILCLNHSIEQVLSRQQLYHCQTNRQAMCNPDRCRPKFHHEEVTSEEKERLSPFLLSSILHGPHKNAVQIYVFHTTTQLHFHKVKLRDCPHAPAIFVRHVQKSLVR
jgi:hypothetical protein